MGDIKMVGLGGIRQPPCHIKVCPWGRRQPQLSSLRLVAFRRLNELAHLAEAVHSVLGAPRGMAPLDSQMAQGLESNTHAPSLRAHFVTDKAVYALPDVLALQQVFGLAADNPSHNGVGIPG